MKTRMKKLISVKSISVLVLVLLVVLGSALAARHYPVIGSGEVYLGTGQIPDPPPDNVRLTIGGKLYEGRVTVELGKPGKGRGSVLYFRDVKHTFDLESGIFYATGDEMATPMGEEGLYSLNGYMQITGGKGEFESACGRLKINGELNRKTEKIFFDVHGAIGL